MRRRDFLKMVVVSAVAAGGSAALIGCGDDEGDDDGNNAPNNDVNNDVNNDGPDPATIFPQGLASGDPSPSTVILWTRVEPEGDGDEAVTFEVSEDEDFTALVASGEVSAEAGADHTVRIKVTGLSAHTTYFYRFSARGAVSRVGRTRTAPAPDQDVPVRFAVGTCQDFNGRYYHAWRLLAEEEEVDFVLFLGDYIYETTNDPRFQSATEDREIQIPDGLVIDEEGDVKAALTLRDYRSLYKQYRSDRALQDAHARFPFVSIWDDHEFADDSWQDHSTHFNEVQGDEKNTERRTVASQAWFEYQPADLERDANASFPNDLKIIRSLRFGKHVELALTDQRSFRDDHVIPEGPSDLTVGKFNANSPVGSRNFVLKEGFDPREAEALPTMLGDEQRQWLIDTLTESDATWKIWGSETQVAQMLVDLSPFEGLPEDFQNVFYFSVDQWDGYRTERAAILEALTGVENLVVLTGDIHAFFASTLFTDFDNPGDPVAVEFVTAGISSEAVREITQRTVDGSPLLSGLGLAELVPRMDELVQAASPHYVHTDSGANGLSLVDVSATAMEVTFVKIPDVQKQDFDGQAPRVRFRVAAGSRQIEAL